MIPYALCGSPYVRLNEISESDALIPAHAYLALLRRMKAVARFIGSWKVCTISGQNAVTLQWDHISKVSYHAVSLNPDVRREACVEADSLTDGGGVQKYEAG
ncbi:hypothetical protein GOBAR_AA16727 [Gossypium barbadense]|uniref:Uncharacterized protein n=1 Tax=Gossypium barbadense TaxID=3634 RepID=A0A2P5XKT9_GOSBA|nr:hypothetical protein GOBAR_AA16727 [Gossypium barbadense]